MPRYSFFPDDSNLPYFAVLSHTWGRPEDDSTFQDLDIDRRGWYKCHCESHKDTLGLDKPSKAVAWSKAMGACHQALALGYGYVWIDTFCIDKSSSAELQEVINSMFRWYGLARACFVYLSDISTPHEPDRDGSEFRQSRWFTRGWTLQELLASDMLILFDNQWREIASAIDLADTISQKSPGSASIISWLMPEASALVHHTGFYLGRVLQRECCGHLEDTQPG